MPPDPSDRLCLVGLTSSLPARATWTRHPELIVGSGKTGQGRRGCRERPRQKPRCHWAGLGAGLGRRAQSLWRRKDVGVSGDDRRGEAHARV